MKNSVKNSGKKPVGRPKKKLSESPVKKMEEKPEKKPIWNSGYMSCWDIAVENYANAVKRDAEGKGLIKKTLDANKNDINQFSEFVKTRTGSALAKELIDCITKQLNHSKVAVVFCAMTLESFINFYAVTKLQSNAYFDDYLDHLKLLAKWVIIPRLAVQKQINRGTHGFECFKKLISYRNAIIHEKPVDIDSQDYLKKLLTKTELKPEIQARTAIDAVKGMFGNLKMIDPDIDTDWIKRIENKYISSL
ncbi:MAG: hypothetical protein AB9903_15645 [Vulcanimicrobiota bacterium]